MNFLSFLMLCLLFVLSWPVALIGLLLYPLFWLLCLAFRLLGLAVEGVVVFLGALVRLPARLLGYRG